jgi:hypothetical protein
MRKRGWDVVVIVALIMTSLATFEAAAEASDDCSFTSNHGTLTLQASCTTDETLVIPVSRLDGQGFTITAVDPPGGHFVGAVVRNGTAELNVSRLRVTAAGLSIMCDLPEDRLAGILLDGAGGTVAFSSVTALNQGDSGCQEGNAIVVRNTDPGRPVNVRIEGNVVSGYQKTGILISGAVRAEVSGNLVDGGPPTASIARNGIEVSDGAGGAVRLNVIKGNSYTGTTAVGAGVLVVGGPSFGAPFTVDLDVTNNAITGADVGVYLDNAEADGAAAATPTRVDVTGNLIANAAVTNGIPYSAGVVDVGNRDRITNNRIEGAAYDPATIPGSTFDIDASLAIDPVVRHNR